MGGRESDSGQCSFLQGVRYLYVAGRTASPNFPTTAMAYDRTYNGDPADGFALKLDLGAPPPLADGPWVKTPVGKSGIPTGGGD